MTRERAVELLKGFQLCCDFDDCTNAWDCDECVEALYMAIEALQEPKWIPVSERLPEDSRPVLIYARSVHHVIARYSEFRTENGDYKKAWVTADAWNGNTVIKHEVIAWMELPEPYEGE